MFEDKHFGNLESLQKHAWYWKKYFVKCPVFSTSYFIISFSKYRNMLQNKMERHFLEICHEEENIKKFGLWESIPTDLFLKDLSFFEHLLHLTSPSSCIQIFKGYSV